MNRFFHPPLLAASLLMCACTVDGPFPSLAQRPAEREAVTEPVRVMPNVPADAELEATVTALLAAARQGQDAFDAAYPPAEAAARAAGAPASDSWVAAQEQISRAEAARAETMRALGDLDRLVLARSDAPTNPGEAAALQATIADVERLALDQQTRIDRLKALSAR